MTKIDYMRQLDFFNPNDGWQPRISIAGCGGIGSFLVEHLAQMGFSDLTVYDNDKVEPHNLPNQNFDFEHIGMFKVNAANAIVKRKTGNQIKKMPVFITPRTRLNADIVMVGTDSIESRRSIYTRAVDRGVKWLIDGRLGGELFQVYVIDLESKEDREFYESTLFNPNDALELPCTARAVIYIALDITANMIRAVSDIVRDNEYQRSLAVDRKNGTIKVNDTVMLYRGVWKCL